MTTPSQPRHPLPLIQGSLIVLLVLLAYFPALRGQFLWDDDINVTNNKTLRTLHGLGQIWCEPGATQQYYPLTHTSFWVDYHLWGMNTMGYHAENILLHAASVLLLWRILIRLGVTGAWWGAAFFALHPVCVESVAWITERKNTLCGIFFLGSILASLRFWLPVRPQSPPGAGNLPVVSTSSYGNWAFYWLALFCYLCALWAKTAAVGLPAVIVLMLWWQRVKFRARDAYLSVPFLAIGTGMGLVTMWMEKHRVGAAGPEWHFSWMARCVIAGRALWFYLGKLLWPHPLAFMYPRWIIQASQPLAYLPLLTAGVCVIGLWRRRDGAARPVLFAAGFFVVMLFPVLGFFNVFFFRFSFVCDHFQYLACMAPLALAGAGLASALDFSRSGRRFLKPAVCGTVLLVFGVLTWRQTGVYRDLETLWRDTIAHNERAWLAHNNLGNIFYTRGDFQGAIQHYRKAIELKPDFATAHGNLGGALFTEGDVAGAIDQLNQCVQIDPYSIPGHNNLGLALDAKGDLDGAAQQFLEILRLNPNYVSAYDNLGSILVRQGKPDDAILQCNRALQIDPNYAPAHDSLGVALAAKGSLEDAIGHYLQALQIQPKLANAHYHLGLAYVEKGDLDQAMAEYEAALKTEPTLAGAHYGEGLIFAKRSQFAQARVQFKETLRLKPDHAEAAKQLQALPP